MKMVFLCSHQI